MSVRKFLGLFASLAAACTSTNATTLDLAPITPTGITAETPALQVGGTVTGLQGSGLRLQLNGTYSLDIANDGPFAFSQMLREGSAYWLVVLSQPRSPLQACTIVVGSDGTVGASSASAITVVCAPAVALRGTVSGLEGSGLRLKNGGETIEINANGSFVFEDGVSKGDAYAVSVVKAPLAPRQLCTVTNASGGPVDDDVTNVAVSCTTYHRVFVTSVAGSSKLSTWPDASGASGLVAADTICNKRASAGGLGGSYVAWLSDANDDAFCRVLGKHGKKDTNCGEATAPTLDVGPWMNLDDRPFADTLAQAIAGAHWSALRVTEFGEPLPPTQVLLRLGTGSEGRASSGTCADWTNDDPTTRPVIWGGLSDVGLGGVYGFTCSERLPLVCLQTGKGLPLPSKPLSSTAQKKAFLTTARGTGRFSSWATAGAATGIAAADAVCMQEAASSSLPGQFKAWLSLPGAAAASRFAGDGPWYRLDGAWLGTKTTLQTQGLGVIMLDRQGQFSIGRAWTGNTEAASTCADFSSEDVGTTGGAGGATRTDLRWSRDAFPTCNETWSLYCFED